VKGKRPRESPEIASSCYNERNASSLVAAMEQITREYVLCCRTEGRLDEGLEGTLFKRGRKCGGF